MSLPAVGHGDSERLSAGPPRGDLVPWVGPGRIAGATLDDQQPGALKVAR